MKECPYCRALVRDDRAICGACGTVFGTEVAALEKASRPSSRDQARRVLWSSLVFLKKHPDLFLLPALLSLLWLSIVAVPAILLFNQPRLEDGLDRLLSMLSLEAIQDPAAGAILQFRSGSLFGAYFWAYALVVSGILAILYALSFPLIVDQGIKTGRVNVEIILRQALGGIRRATAAFLLYAGIVFVLGIILLDFFFLPAGEVFSPTGAIVASISFTFFWSYAMLRIWLVFPALGIDRVSASEAFGLSLDSTRRNLRSSYLCVLAILAVLYAARGAVSSMLFWSPGSALATGLVALISIVVGGTVVGVVPSIYYYQVGLRTDVKSMLETPRLEALQKAR